MLSLFISNAYAQEAGAKASGSGFEPFIMMIVIFAIFYLIVIRPQSKKQKQLKQMVSEAKRGDDVITSSGLHGKIVDVKDTNIVMLEVANNVVLKMERAAIQHISGYEIGKKKTAA